MNKIGERLYNGLIKENPTFVLMLGMCPTLAVTTSAINGLGMGLTTTVVLALSNMIIALLRNIIPDRVRIPAFIVIIASFVTLVQMILQAYIPFLYSALGIYIPLIVVNCIILGRAESYASKNPVIPSLFDGIGMGLGFSFALTCIGAVREIIGAGEIFGYHFMPASYTPVAIFIMAPGAFFVLAVLTAIQNYVKIKGEEKGKDMSKIQSGCGSDCSSCKVECSSRNTGSNVAAKKAEAVKKAEPVKAAETAKKPEAAKTAEPVKEAEEAKTAEVVKKPEAAKTAEPVKEAEAAKTIEAIKEAEAVQKTENAETADTAEKEEVKESTKEATETKESAETIEKVETTAESENNTQETEEKEDK